MKAHGQAGAPGRDHRPAPASRGRRPAAGTASPGRPTPRCRGRPRPPGGRRGARRAVEQVTLSAWSRYPVGPRVEVTAAMAYGSMSLAMTWAAPVSPAAMATSPEPAARSSTRRTSAPARDGPADGAPAPGRRPRRTPRTGSAGPWPASASIRAHQTIASAARCSRTRARRAWASAGAGQPVAVHAEVVLSLSHALRNPTRPVTR